VRPATRNAAYSALLPVLFCQLRPSELYIITCVATGPSRRDAQHSQPESRTPPRGVRDLHVSPGLPGAHACTPSRGSGAAACPATAGVRKPLTCGARRTPSRYIWKTVPPTSMTTPPARTGRTPARSPQDQGRYPRQLPRPTPCPTVYFLQCSTTVPRDSGENDDFHAPLLLYTAPPYDYKRRRQASFKGEDPFWTLLDISHRGHLHS
jgi:hypothetical protein